MERLLWWVLAGSRGGASRARIMAALRVQPYNANRLAEKLSMSYKTIRHHLDVLEKNVIVVARGERYARLYYLSKNMTGHYAVFEQICHKLGIETRVTPEPRPEAEPIPEPVVSDSLDSSSATASTTASPLPDPGQPAAKADQPQESVKNTSSTLTNADNMDD